MGLSTFGGVNVTISPHAVQRRENWPIKRRSKRLYKKLTKKRGPQFTEVPCAFQTPMGLVVHPEVWAQMRAQSAPIARPT